MRAIQEVCHGRSCKSDRVASIDTCVGNWRRLPDPLGIADTDCDSDGDNARRYLSHHRFSPVRCRGCARELSKARTAFDVRKPTTNLVRQGVFRLSRNPVYFSMLLLCAAIALLANSVALLALSLPAGSALCLLVIRKEERYLEQKFGSEYLAYKASVRRWI